MVRTGGVPRQLQAKIVPMVQVILDYMGTHQQMCARKNWTKTELIASVKSFLGTSHNPDARPLGIDVWEIRAGTTYEIQETRKVNLKCMDVDGKKFTIQIE
jgi:hypothetical protein